MLSENHVEGIIDCGLWKHPKSGFPWFSKFSTAVVYVRRLHLPYRLGSKVVQGPKRPPGYAALVLPVLCFKKVTGGLDDLLDGWDIFLEIWMMFDGRTSTHDFGSL